MRIGIDARQLCGESTGVGRYLAGLLGEWATGDAVSRHEFVLYVPEPISFPLDSRKFPTRTIPGTAGTWWEQFRLPRRVRRDHLDVFFAPQYTAPLTLRLPFVVTIHDVSFAAHPEWFRVREGLRLRTLVRRAAVGARAVITVSEFSRRELLQWISLPEDRVHVVHNGIPARHIVPAAVKAPRLLFVGSIFNRRHVVDLIRAFAPLARERRDASLDIVGANRTHPHEDIAGAIVKEGLAEQVRWHDYASDEQVRDLYARARAFAFLSEYEGFGLTPLEALAAGVPAVVADAAAARETCEEAAVYVQLGALAPITRALEQVLFDEGVRARLLAAAPGVVAKYSWSRAARETLRVIEAAG